MIEVAEIFRRYGPQYRTKFADRMPPSHLKAMLDIERCRTETLGGHVYKCTACGKLQYSYHSCTNRSCPKCQNEEATLWLDRQETLLLPVPYFMITFTLPEELRELARSHQKILYNLLFRCSAQAVKTLTSDPRHLGGTIGIVGVLQTWTRDLCHHPHVHYLIPAGALSPDGNDWVPSRYRRWLVPVKALSKIFRGKLKDALARKGLLGKIPSRVWKKPWVVHCKPVGTGKAVLKYLAPYVYRIAISNRRIENIENGFVTFRYKNRDSRKSQHRTLSAEEFIHRFLQHVLPRGFQKVRYFGFLHPNRKPLLEQIRRILPQPNPRPSPEVAQPEQSIDVLDADTEPHPRCLKCGGALLLLYLLPPQQRSPPRPLRNAS
jgi:hypothetical protein